MLSAESGFKRLPTGGGLESKVYSGQSSILGTKQPTAREQSCVTRGFRAECAETKISDFKLNLRKVSVTWLKVAK